MSIVSCPHCGRAANTEQSICNHCSWPLPEIIETSSRSGAFIPSSAISGKSSSVVKCPQCGSQSIQLMKKGFGLGKAAAGGLMLGPVGLLGGAVGSNKVQRVCANCGHKF